jgi:hypothetical protein
MTKLALQLARDVNGLTLWPVRISAPTVV